MKYIIPQDKLDKIAFKYLDKNLSGMQIRHYPKFFKGIIIYHPDDDNKRLGLNVSGTLLIPTSMLENINTVFGLYEPEAEKLIARWLSDRFKLEVESTYSFSYAPKELY
jgi:hypothetical protein